MIKILGVVVLVFIVFVLGLYLWMLLWNYAMPHIFGLPTISYLQGVALWLIILSVGGAFRAGSYAGR